MTLKCSILRVVLWLNILSWSSGFHLGKTARLKSANCTTTSFLCNVLLHLVTRPFSLRFGDSTGMRYRCMRRRPLKHVRDFAIGWVCFGVKLCPLDFFCNLEWSLTICQVCYFQKDTSILGTLWYPLSTRFCIAKGDDLVSQINPFWIGFFSSALEFHCHTVAPQK